MTRYIPWDLIFLGNLSLLHRHQVLQHNSEISEKGMQSKGTDTEDLLYGHGNGPPLQNV